MNDDRERELLLRALAAQHDAAAAACRLGVAMARATAAMRGVAEAINQHEARTFFDHPDLQEIDLADAAWNP